jgi:hypothetical protein
MKTVYLVSCVSEKAGSCLPAEELYASDWFKKARCYVSRQMKGGDEWYILSAKHHVVTPRQRLEPYNETLKKMRRADRLRWTQRVLGQLRQILQPGDIVVMLAGERYREILEPGLCSLGCIVNVPMRGLRIGQQLSWLKNN